VFIVQLAYSQDCVILGIFVFTWYDFSCIFVQVYTGNFANYSVHVASSYFINFLSCDSCGNLLMRVFDMDQNHKRKYCRLVKLRNNRFMLSHEFRVKCKLQKYI